MVDPYIEVYGDSDVVDINLARNCTLIKSFFYGNGTILLKDSLQKRKISLRFGRVSERSLAFFMISRSILSDLSDVKTILQFCEVLIYIIYAQMWWKQF